MSHISRVSNKWVINYQINYLIKINLTLKNKLLITLNHKKMKNLLFFRKFNKIKQI